MTEEQIKQLYDDIVSGRELQQFSEKCKYQVVIENDKMDIVNKTKYQKIIRGIADSLQIFQVISAQQENAMIINVIGSFKKGNEIRQFCDSYQIEYDQVTKVISTIQKGNEYQQSNTNRH